MNVERMLQSMLSGVVDNISHVKYMYVTKNDIETYSANDNPFYGGTTLFPIPMTSALDIIEEWHPDNFDILDSLYGEYNSYALSGSAISPDAIFCWFSRE